MANVNFYNVVAKDGQTAAERFAAMEKDNQTFYLIGSPATDLYIGAKKITNASDLAALSSTVSGLSDTLTLLQNTEQTEGSIRYIIADYLSQLTASDIAITDTAGYFESDDVEGALAELASASSGGVASKTIYVTDNSSGQSDYAKVYKIWQGTNAPDAQTNPATLIGTINIPKDKVLEDSSIVNITFSENKLWDGATDVTALIKGSDTPTAADAGKYLKMEMQNVTDPLYVNLQTFVDVYTVASGATEIQLALNDHELSASVVAVDGSKVVYKAETSSGAGDGETVKQALTRLDGSDSTTGSVAKKVKDAIDALDADLDASGTAQHSGTFVVSGVVQTNGVLTAVDSVEVEAAGAAAAVVGTGTGRSGSGTELDPYVYEDTIKGTKTLVADKFAEAESAATASIEALDLTEAPLAEVSSNVVTIHGISQTDGQVAVGVSSTNDVVLEEVAMTGAAADVSIVDSGSFFIGATVEAALQEVAGKLTWEEI